MTGASATLGPGHFRHPHHAIGELDAATAARVVAASSDVALVLDRGGVIRDIAVSTPGQDFPDCLGQRWTDAVTVESRQKVDELLAAAQGDAPLRWREINHRAAGGSVPLKFVAIGAGRDGRVIAFGRDQRGIADLQQRLLQIQQDMERDYVRLRQTELRYRLLFQNLSEAIVVVDAASRKILEINPAGAALAGASADSLINQPFARLFGAESREAAATALRDAAADTKSEPHRVRLAGSNAAVYISASSFRHDAATHLLVRLVRTDAAPAVETGGAPALLRVLNRIPDAFAVTDDSFVLLECNLAFLELAHLPSADAAKGEPLSRFLGRPGVDLTVLAANLREHGWVRNFGTVFNSGLGADEEVEISAVSVRDGLENFYGFVIRPVRARVPAKRDSAVELPRTAEQVKGLVGRMSLKDIVRETTDVIERMCIEAALSLTQNNRASAAELLGLSRQSLYSKLNRFGMNGQDATD